MDIYKITNLVNNKIYIGKTKNDYLSRYKNHIKLAKSNKESNQPIILAIRKYGKDNFKVECIDNASSIEELNDKEKYWIQYYNSQSKDVGYNISNGGDGGDIFHTLSIERQEESILKRKNYFISHPDAAENFSNKMRENNLGSVKSQTTKDKISKKQKESWQNNYDRRVDECCRQLHEDEVIINKRNKSINEYWDNLSDEERILRSNKQSKKWEDPEYRSKQSSTRKSKEYLDKMSNLKSTLGYKYIYNKYLDIEKLVPLEELEEFTPWGFTLGRKPFSNSTKLKMSESKKNRHKEAQLF